MMRTVFSAVLLSALASGCAAAPRPAAVAPIDSARDEMFAAAKTWKQGAGMAFHVSDSLSGKTATYVLATSSPPEWRERAKGWVTIAKAVVGETAVATAVITLTELRPGRFEGGGAKHECFVGWTPHDVRDTSGPEYTQAPDFAWSDIETGFCEVELKDGPIGGQLEGRVRAKVFTNARDRSFSIDTGFVYIVR